MGRHMAMQGCHNASTQLASTASRVLTRRACSKHPFPSECTMGARGGYVSYGGYVRGGRVSRTRWMYMSGGYNNTLPSLMHLHKPFTAMRLASIALQMQ